MAASALYLNDEETASAGGRVASTNFTVVKVDVVLDGLGEAAEEVDGAYLAAAEDAPGAITPAGTSGMLAVSFSCTPGDLPPEEMVRIANLGPGRAVSRGGRRAALRQHHQHTRVRHRREEVPAPRARGVKCAQGREDQDNAPVQRRNRRGEIHGRGS